MDQGRQILVFFLQRNRRIATDLNTRFHTPTRFRPGGFCNSRNALVFLSSCSKRMIRPSRSSRNMPILKSVQQAAKLALANFKAVTSARTASDS